MEVDCMETLCSPAYFNHLKHVRNEVLCVVCKIQEGEGENWDRYELACGHCAHTRCQRRLIIEKNCLYCAGCEKDLRAGDRTRHCGRCGNFGHMSKTCHLPQPVHKSILQTCHNCHKTFAITDTGAKHYDCHICSSRMEAPF